MRKWFLIFFFVSSLSGIAQKATLTPQSEISIITCGPGNEMYSTFGHSAIRVKDATQGIDVVYNYGTFDFTTPNFTLKFARGKLDYTLARQNFRYFLLSYEEENRWVKEQVLDLNLGQRQKLFDFLENNYLPENRDYKYDFFFNNCATKIWDVLKEVFRDELVFDESYLTEFFTHRQLIRQNVATNTWLGFGIDLALGSVIDDMATPKEHMFLPIYTMAQLKRADLGAKPVASKPKILFKPRPTHASGGFLISPAFWLAIFFLLVLIWTFLDLKNNTRRRWLDFALFFFPGLIGLLIIFLWFFTDHTETAANFNIVWAFPLHLVIAFIVAKKKGPNWVAKYALFSASLILVCMMLWLFNIQVFSPIIMLVWLALTTRYLFLFWSYQKPKLA